MFVEPIRLVHRRDDADCAVTAIQLVTGKEYREIVQFMTHSWPKRDYREGLTDWMIRRTLLALGFPVRFSRTINAHTDYGIVRFTDHVAVLKRGLVLNPHEGCTAVWEWEHFIRDSPFCKGDRDVHGIFLAAR